MPIYNIPLPINNKDFPGWDINEDILSSFEVINNFENRINEIRLKNNFLRDLPIEDILNYFDSLAVYWLTDKTSEFLNSFSSLGVSFLINFIKRVNLEALLKESLHGDIHYLDDFIDVPTLNKQIMAHPQGVITHWLAGNVPVLGMISLIQGIITKNVNIVKLPRENGLVLPLIASQIASIEFNFDNRIIKGSDLLSCCMLIYCDKDDRKGQEILSINSDIRVAWGGKEAVETVMSLPRKYGTDDVIFGPKYSFAVIGRDSFNIDKLKNITYNLALDGSVFEQQGCNSPHTIFVENGGEVSPLDFAKSLAVSMDDALKRIPRSPVSADEANTTINVRAEYSFMGRVFSSKGTEWTVIYSEEKGLAEASYSRTIFVRPVDDITEIFSFIEKNKHQTLGLCIRENEKKRFAKEATKMGIERVTELGKMSVFDYPWDGMFPIDRFVRWTSLK